MPDMIVGALDAGAGAVPPEVAILTQRHRIGEREIAEAAATLVKYKDGKVNLERRIIEDELWWELRHWETLRRQKRDNGQVTPEPSSAWLFNAILNKHADAMDNYPEPVALPREASDEASAKVLSQILPVVMEYNKFDDTYSRAWWEKLKHGTSVYGVFWDPEVDNGLGDIDIKEIDLLKIFWEPGITDIQQSANLFIAELVNTKTLEAQYPEHYGKLKADTVHVEQYLYDDTVDVTDKSVVVDWYYKVQQPSGRTVVHYAKFVGNVLLYASENEPEYAGRGWYDHGKYPVVFDTLFPEKGTPCGFGYVAICKDPQLYIDKLSANVLETSLMATKKRFFASDSLGINEKEFLDWNKPIIHVSGDLSENRLRELVTQPLGSVYLDVMTQKIEEMKDTVGNRDVNSGGTGSSVTAAAAIAALQEAGNKSSRDMIAASYRKFCDVVELCIDLMRQFYDEERSFRITAPNGTDYQFVGFSNAQIGEQPIKTALGDTLYRKPVFDLKIKAQKKNPFSRMEENERAKELYGMGFFNPERAQEALDALEMMDFEGIDAVKERIQQGQTLYNVVQQQQQLIAALTGTAMPTATTGTPQSQQTASTPLTDGIMQAQTPMTGYGQRLAKRSTPSVEG